MQTAAERAKQAEKEAMAKIQANELKKIEVQEAQEAQQKRTAVSAEVKAKEVARIGEEKAALDLGLNVYMTGDGKYYRGKTPHNPGDMTFVFPTKQMRAVLTEVPMLRSEMDRKITIYEIEEENKRVKL